MEGKYGKALYCYWIAFIIALGGLLQSYVTCIIAGAISSICDEFCLSPLKQGNVASIILAGAIIGSLCAAKLADRIGRKCTLMIAVIIYLITALISVAIHSYFSLLLLRMFTGVAVGMSAMVVPIYLAEIAPPEKRGAFVSNYQFFLTIGTFIAYLTHYFRLNNENWRFMFFIAAIPALFQWIALIFLPESPRWLINQGQKEKAEQIFLKIGGQSSEAVQSSGSEKRKLFSHTFIFLIVLGSVLSIFQQLSGINAMIYFAPKIYGEAGFSKENAVLATLLVGAVNMIATLLTILMVDRFGRKKLLLVSEAGVVGGLAMLVFSFLTESNWIDFLATGAVPLYVFFYSLGLGPIVWVLISEMFPLAVRAKAIAFFTVINWVTNYLIVLSFPYLLSAIGAGITFSLYGLLSIGAFFFFLFYVPETKGKSLEQLEKELLSPKDE